MSLLRELATWIPIDNVLIPPSRAIPSPLSQTLYQAGQRGWCVDLCDPDRGELTTLLRRWLGCFVLLGVMLTIEGLGVIAGENAINAALKAVRETVNNALPFKLL